VDITFQAKSRAKRLGVGGGGGVKNWVPCKKWKEREKRITPQKEAPKKNFREVPSSKEQKPSGFPKKRGPREVNASETGATSEMKMKGG